MVIPGASIPAARLAFNAWLRAYAADEDNKWGSDVVVVVNTTAMQSLGYGEDAGSAALYMGNADAVLSRAAITAGVQLCRPLSCPRTYVLQPNDTCVSIETAQGLPLRSVRRYNAWLDMDCPNLQAACYA
ncbi:hypothetical protein SLS53_004472 [Cytospora paraplurivora]|uniref:LysM domain-containing protein n=1 Tax=Cytospora paraplurivora TaxID=2898453 RepID=A0AAN9YFM0_9PEZI